MSVCLRDRQGGRWQAKGKVLLPGLKADKEENPHLPDEEETHHVENHLPLLRDGPAIQLQQPGELLNSFKTFFKRYFQPPYLTNRTFFPMNIVGSTNHFGQKFSLNSK